MGRIIEFCLSASTTLVLAFIGPQGHAQTAQGEHRRLQDEEMAAIVGSSAPGRAQQASQRPAVSSSMIDLSGRPPGSPNPYQLLNEGAYSPALEARSLRIFPWASQEEERQKWMAAQEQRLIANEINRTKPLIYPAR
jgi:hypothetical protein